MENIRDKKNKLNNEVELYDEINDEDILFLNEGELEGGDLLELMNYDYNDILNNVDNILDEKNELSEYNMIQNGGSGYPRISDKDFYKRINRIYKSYKIPERRKTFREICFPERYQLQNPQIFVSKYINPKSPYKGVLVYHRIGSGKTCTAIQVCEEWKRVRRVIVLLPASLIAGFRNELRSKCAGENYLRDDERERLLELHPSDDEYKEIIRESDERIDKYYNIYSYNKFFMMLDEGEINLRNTIMIIDEIQNLVSEEGAYYNKLYKLVKDAPRDFRLVIMSATPMFDKPLEIGLTMNLLDIPKEIPVGIDFVREFIDIKKTKSGKYNLNVKNKEKFKSYIKGFVSYYRGAPPYVFPEMKIKIVKCEMSEFQLKAYNSILKNEYKKMGISKKLSRKNIIESLQVGDLPNSFFLGTRYVSNVVFPNKKINEEGFISFNGEKIRKNLKEYSIKFDEIMNKINTKGGKTFVYSNFKEYGGIKSFVKVLEEFGYKNYMEHGEGKKRFAIFSGDETIKEKDEIRAVYNQKNNLDGSKLKIIILSPSAKEGLSLFGVRNAHILEPYWNWSRILQIIGRGSRFCSHKDLDKDKRNIKIYIYCAIHPNIKESVDEYILYLAKQKNKIINEFERLLKEMAVDCELFKNANVYKGEEDIKCEK